MIYDLVCYIFIQYLGEMEEEGVASVQEEDTTLSLPLLYVPERVLFPGETVPMHIYNPHVHKYICNHSYTC